MTCQNCLYWIKQAPPQGAPTSAGLCKRFPPTALLLPGQPIGLPVFPITAAGEWCGEWTETAPPEEPLSLDLSARRPSLETLGMSLEVEAPSDATD